MSEHSLLSPSGAYRWLNCPGSVRFTENLPDRSSEYAEEGTLAHKFCELYLRKRFTTSIGPKKFREALKALKDDPLYKPEMDRHVETYVDLIDQITNAYPSLPYVAVEQKVNINTYVPECSGTCDCIVIGKNSMHVIDFKYGQGQAVEVEDNPQLMLYALGAMDHYAMLYDIQQVSMTICQPRKDNIQTFSRTAADLRAWGESVKPIARQAFDGCGQLNEGDWCKKGFCKANGRCPAQVKEFTAIEDFADTAPELLTNAQIGGLLPRAERVLKWIATVEAIALTACLNGEEVPGWKAVEGKSDRAFSNAEAAFAAAKQAGIDEAVLYERKPVTLAGLERIMGKAPFAETLGSYVIKPPGKPALVPDTDNRKPITRTTAIDDFEEDM